MISVIVVFPLAMMSAGGVCAAIYFVHCKTVLYFFSCRPLPHPILPLFICSFFSALMWSVLAIFALFVLIEGVAYSDRGLMVGCLMIFGFIYGAIRLIGYFFRRKIGLATLESKAISKYQVWMADILIGAAIFGLCITVIRNYLAYYGQDQALLGFILMEFFNLTLAFLLSMEMLRFLKFAADGKRRAIFLALIMLVSTVPLAILPLLAAWTTCRKVLASGPAP